MNPRFSIITCTRNSMGTLHETVRSVQCQDFCDYEHIFVDGGSTDGTLDYLRQLPGNIKILEDRTGGISQAMNAGVQAASGEYVCHLHSDDYFIHSRVLSRVSAAFEKQPAKWLFGRIVTDQDGGMFPETYRIPRYSYRQILKGNFIPHPAMFIARSAFAEVGGFSEHLRLAMDYELILRLGAKYEPLQLAEVFTAFRKHDGSATQSNWLKSFDEQYTVRCEYLPKEPLTRLMAALRYRYSRARIVARSRRS